MLDAVSIFAVALSGLLPANMPSILDRMNLPTQTRQVLVVSSGGWEETAGQMKRYVREADGWHSVGTEWSIVLGTKGMGWGKGLHQPVATGPQKVEGDGRAPAGIFTLGTAFGYAAMPPPGTRWSYKICSTQDYFVDDATSPDYNRWVTLSGTESPTKKWASFERMRRSDALYELGLVVNHNTTPPLAGLGSAIFLHVWRGSDRGTAGCTAMPLDKIASLIRWLEPAMQPVIIQAPKDQFDNIRFK